jgi:O-antigen/teichoic acid export membrane protein
MEAVITRILKKETKETFWSVATKALSGILFILLNTYLARKLGVEFFGTWAFLLSNVTIVFLLSYFGLNNATKAFVAQHAESGQLREVLRSSLILRLLFSIIFTGGFILFHKQLATLVKRPDLSSLFLFSSPLVFLMGFVEYFKQAFTGFFRLKYHFIINLFEHGLKILLVILLLNLVVNLEGVILSYSLAVLVASFVGSYFFLRFYRASAVNSNTRQTVRPLLKQIFRYSLPLFFISMGFLILTEVNTLMLGLLSTDREVGLFAVGNQLASKLPQVALALSMGTMPVFARMDASNKEALWRKFLTILRVNGLIFIPLGVFLITLSPLLVPLVFGEDYTDAVLPLQILTFWIVMSAFNIYFNALLDYQGHANRRALNFSLTMVGTVVLNLLLIPRFGAVGAATSITISYIPYVIFNWLELRRIFRQFD